MSRAPDPDQTVGLSAYVYPLKVKESEGLVRLVRQLGFEDSRATMFTGTRGRVTQVRRWVNDVVCCIAERPREEPSPIRFVDVYAHIRRALRACVDPDFQKGFWAARLVGGYRAAADFLISNAPARRVNRTAKDTRDALDAAWRLHDPEALQPIVAAIGAIPPGGSATINGCVVRRGKAGWNELRYWISSPYMGREFSTPREPQRLHRPLWEAALLATMGAERPRSPRRR